MDILEQLPGVLLPWFDENKRDLPWRQDTRPYHVWLSEIMLQQTRVEAVKLYYTRFLAELPTIEMLAMCDDERLHKLWEGLGYYSRVRNLKKAAQIIVRDFDGHFPDRYEDVLSLPGIGSYTAGAICSIAFNRKTAAVDGNVLRVYARLLDDDTPIDHPDFKEKVHNRLQAVYPQRAGAFTQAVMELGATLCGPNRVPQCGECPCRGFCLGFREGTAAHLPVKRPKPAKRQESRTVFILEHEGRFALSKRPEKGLLAGLWQFPDAQGCLNVEEAVDRIEKWGMPVRDVQRQLDKKHIFTHIVWNMRGYFVQVRIKSEKFEWFSPEEIARNAALPTAYRQFWEARGK